MLFCCFQLFHFNAQFCARPVSFSQTKIIVIKSKKSGLGHRMLTAAMCTLSTLLWAKCKLEKEKKGEQKCFRRNESAGKSACHAKMKWTWNNREFAMASPWVSRMNGTRQIDFARGSHRSLYCNSTRHDYRPFVMLCCCTHSGQCALPSPFATPATAQRALN